MIRLKREPQSPAVRNAWILVTMLVLVTTRPVVADSLLGTSHFYPGLYYPGVADSSGVTRIELEPGDSFELANIPMAEAGGSVVGTVRGEEGPLAGVHVEASRGRVVVDGLTNDDGVYSLEGVPAGNIRIRFSTDSAYSRDRAHQALYYPGVATVEEAELVEVASGEQTSLGETLLPNGATIAGYVTAADDEEPLSEVSVRLMNANGKQWVFVTRTDGGYRFPGLLPGPYTVFAEPPANDPYIAAYYGGARDSLDADLVFVDVGQLRDDLDVSLSRGASISGTVRDKASGVPYPDMNVEAFVRGAEEVYRVETNDFGVYTFRGLPASTDAGYVVFVPRLARYWPGVAREEEARAIRVGKGETSSNRDVQGVDLDLCQLPKAAQGIITGNIDADFELITSAIVRAISDVDTIDVAIEEPGVYTIECVEPGDYRVMVIPNGRQRTQYFPEVHELEDAEFVTVDGDTADVDFELEDGVSISGVVADLGGIPFEDIDVVVRDARSGVTTRVVTDVDGRFFAAQQADGSGLPAGSYYAYAESTVIGDPEVTPIFQPWIEAVPDPAGAAVDLRFELPGDFEWTYEIRRLPAGSEEDGADGGTEVTTGNLLPGDATAQFYRDLVPNPGNYVYNLKSRPLLEGSPLPLELEAWTNEIRVGPRPPGALLAVPSPWNGQGRLSLRSSRDPREGSTDDWRLQLFSVSGRMVGELDWNLALTGAADREPSTSGAQWDGRIHGAPAPSGLYFVRLVDGSGQEQSTGTVVLQR